MCHEHLGRKGVDSCAEHGRCLFRLRRRQESWSQAGNDQTQVGMQEGESKLGLKAITTELGKRLVESKQTIPHLKAQTE